MNFDMSNLLDYWEYEPGQVMVRRFIGNDGHEKIQLRVDLGILQMNAKGRPDGKRPFGYPSLWEYFQARLEKYRSEHDGDDEGFILNAEDASRIQLEALQFHHRYICLLQLEDFDAVLQDTQRNLAVFSFVQEHAETEELAWGLNQFKPQVLMIRIRAQAAQTMAKQNYDDAIQKVEAGLGQLRDFYQEINHPELAEQSGEVLSLEEWLGDLRSKRPLSQRERLERALDEAIQNENYEKAAQVRDALRKMESAGH